MFAVGLSLVTIIINFNFTFYIHIRTGTKIHTILLCNKIRIYQFTLFFVCPFKRKEEKKNVWEEKTKDIKCIL